MADLDLNTSDDPAADFLAQEQADLAGLEDEFEYGKTTATNGNGLGLDDVDQVNGDESEDVDVHYNGLSDINNDSSTLAPVENKPEPEKIRVWREEQTKLLEQKDAEEAKKKEELRQHSKKELEEWYARYAEQLEKSKLNNRNAEKEWIAERDVETPGQEWEKIAKMCDFNPKAVRNTKDTSRMRSILLQLKQTPPANASK